MPPKPPSIDLRAFGVTEPGENDELSRCMHVAQRLFFYKTFVKLAEQAIDSGNEDAQRDAFELLTNVARGDGTITGNSLIELANDALIKAYLMEEEAGGVIIAHRQEGHFRSEFITSMTDVLGEEEVKVIVFEWKDWREVIRRPRGTA